MPRSNNEGRKHPRKKKGTASASKRIAPVACLNPFPVPSMEAVPHAYKASRDGLSFFNFYRVLKEYGWINRYLNPTVKPRKPVDYGAIEASVESMLDAIEKVMDALTTEAFPSIDSGNEYFDMMSRYCSLTVGKPLWNAENESTENYVYLTITRARPTRRLGWTKSLQQLEKISPGSAAWLLSKIDALPLSIATPQRIKDHCETWHNWDDEVDEDEVPLVTREEWDKLMPQWLFNPVEPDESIRHPVFDLARQLKVTEQNHLYSKQDEHGLFGDAEDWWLYIIDYQPEMRTSLIEEITDYYGELASQVGVVEGSWMRMDHSDDLLSIHLSIHAAQEMMRALNVFYQINRIMEQDEC